MELTVATARRIEEMPGILKAEFPQVPLDAIEHDVAVRVRRLIEHAHFDDYVPLLVHHAVRERLRAVN